MDLTPYTYANYLTQLFEGRFDDVTKTTKHQLASEDYRVPGPTGLLFSLEEDGKRVRPVMRLRYQGRDWIFVSHHLLQIGNEQIPLDPPKMYRDNQSFRVWEWANYRAEKISPEDPVWRSILLLSKAESPDNAKVVFLGDTYRHDHDVTAEECFAAKCLVDLVEYNWSEPKAPVNAPGAK